MKSFKDVTKQLDEVLTKSTPTGEWIHDFVHSDNPKFKGKSAAKRKQMALAAYYAKKNESASPSQNSKTEVDMNESKDTSHVVNHDSEDVKASHNYVHKQASVVAKRNSGKLTRHSNTHSEVNYPNGQTTHIKTSFNGKHAVSHIKHHYSESVSLDEDQYTSEYKIKSYVDPITGENKTRKIRPHRVNFKNSKMHGEPAQKDSQGDYGMKEDVKESRGHKILANYFKNKDIMKNIASQSPEEKAEHEKKHREAMTKAHNEYVKKNPNSIFKPMKEEAEQIDELSKHKLVQYIDKASQDVHNKALEAGKDSEKPGKASDFIKKYQKSGKRQAGITKAAVKLAREEVELEEDLDTDHIHQLLANKDINSQVKGGKVHVHSSNVKAAKMHLGAAGHKHEVVGGLNEDQEEDDRQAAEHHQKELEQQELEAKKKKEKVKEEVDLDEGKVYDPFTKKMVATKPIKVQAGGGATRNGVPVETGPSKYKQGLKEEQLDELKKSTLASYVKKAHKDNALTANDLGHQLALSKRPGLSAGTDPTYTKGKNKYLKRSTGIDKAVSKLAKEEVMDEATTYKGIGTDVVDKKKVLNPPIPLTQKKKEVKDFKEGDTYDEKWKEYKGKSFKKESVMLKFNDFLEEAKKWTKEELVGKQHKLDKNHNGKLDADDFKKLRKEESESIEESYPTKQHFEQMAALIKSHDDEKKRSDLAHHHAGIFKGQNPRFDHKKFMHACGVHESAVCEEVEPIEELSKSTLASYVPKAARSARIHGQISSEYKSASDRARKSSMKDSLERLSKKYKNRAWNREDGIKRAADKLAKEEVQIDELKASTLKSYSNKSWQKGLDAAYDAAHNIDKEKNYQLASKRFAGSFKAKSKLDKMKEEVQIDELSKGTLASYAKASTFDAAKQGNEIAKLGNNLSALSKVNGPMYKLNKRLAGHGKAVDKLAKEEIEKITENIHAASKELSDYAEKHSGMDKKDFHSAAKHMASGDHGALKQHIKSLDSEPRDKILTVLHKHGNDIKRYGYSMDEETLDELSKATLGSYVKGAAKDIMDRDARINNAFNKDPAGGEKGLDKAFNKQSKRTAGFNKAVDKLTKEEVEQIDELKASTLSSYVKKAASSLDKSHSGAKKAYSKYDETGSDKDLDKGEKNSNTFNKRLSGISTATNKLNQKKKVGDLGEEVEQELSPYLKATLAVMDEGKIDNLRDAQALRKAGGSSYEKELKPDTKHPHIQVVKGTSYGGENQKDDEHDEKSDDGEKRGRGRPSGSKSGAR